MWVLHKTGLLVLVLMVLGSNAAPEGCGLPERLTKPDLRKVLEVRWVLVQAFSDYPAGVEMVSRANSSLLEVDLKDDNETVQFTERNTVSGMCLIFRGNLSAPDPETSNHTLLLLSAVQEFDGKVSPYGDQGRADVYQSCPECLLMVYHGVFEGTPGRMLLIYRSEGKHVDVEVLKAAHSANTQMAECLKFNILSQFNYDGTAEFCLDKKKEEKEASDGR
ncbi:saxitoxin and tetrodotoxin-binding protein 2-like [Morone saxatilis]|uniref:saxitoxin and tetrodotoxin-binding protein 2-like n=1 Tax=Morone saxatilis TaxID=34816 RepID=UPI0015E1BC80|nr:saxitoxin and tetrodotoxin-binding protein 2-like [Morone saxatilis]